MGHPAKRIILINTIGTLGYISLLLQWAWSLLILCYPLLSSRPDFLFPVAISPSQSTPEISAEFTPLAMMLAGIVTIAILVTTIVVLIRLPKAIGKRGATITHSTAQAIIPKVTHHKKITKKERTRLSHQLIILLKLVAICLPLLSLSFSGSLEQLPDIVVWTLALFLAGGTLLYFGLQELIARLARVDPNMIW